MPDGASPVPVAIFVVATIVIATICQQIYFYLSISLGQVLSKNKIIGSVLGYVIIYAVNQIINLVLILVLLLCIGFDNLEAFMSSTKALLVFLGVLIGEYIILGSASFILSGRILKNRLNLT